MIKNLLVVLGLILLLISAGTIGLYKLVGTYSGQDAVCISGILAGLVVGLWLGKNKGFSVLTPILVSAVIVSLPLFLISTFIAHANQDLVESLAFFSIGFSLLFFYIVGCGWGKHLTKLSI